MFAVPICRHGVDRGNSTSVSNAPGKYALFPSTSIKACRYSSMQACGFFMDLYDTYNCSFVSPRWLYGAKELCQALCQPLGLQGTRSVHPWVSASFACHCQKMAQNRLRTQRSFPSAHSRQYCGCASSRFVYPINSTAAAYIYTKSLSLCIATVIGDFNHAVLCCNLIWNAANSNLLTNENVFFCENLLRVWDKVSPHFL
jgi:hypothetical protein